MSEHLPGPTSPGSRPRTMAGTWRYWEKGCRSPWEGELRVAGTALKVQGPPSVRLPGYSSTLPHCLLRSREKGVSFTSGAPGARTRAASDPSARAAPASSAAPRRARVSSAAAVPLEGAAGSPAPLKLPQARAGLPYDPRASWTLRNLSEPRPQKSRTLSVRSRLGRDWQASETTSLASVALSDLWDEELDSESRFAEDSITPSKSYFSLIGSFLKPEKPTRAAIRLMEKTLEVMKLDKQVREAQVQQREVLEETRLLLNEKLYAQADTKFVLDHLTNKSEEYRREINKLWDSYAQESGEIQRRRQELASKYAKQTSELQKQLLEREKKKFDLQQQLRALRDVSLVKEKQDREMQTLQEELKKAQAETTAKAYAQYLQEKAFLEKQLSEPAVNLWGKGDDKELQRKAQAVEVTAERLAFEYCLNLRRENQRLHRELAQQCQQCQEMQAAHSHLQTQKLQLHQEQWYMECLLRGRQRLQRGAPKPTATSLGTKD